MREMTEAETTKTLFDECARLRERNAELEAALRVIARELPYIGDGADVGAMEIAVKVLDEK